MDFEVKIIGYVEGEAELPEDLIEKIMKILPARCVPTHFHISGTTTKREKEEHASGLHLLKERSYSTTQDVRILALVASKGKKN